MPFVDAAGNHLDRLPLLYRLGRDFQVLEPFFWNDPRSGPVIEIPAHDPSKPPGGGNSTDFASVPPFLWGLVASYGKQTLPAIMHDALTEAIFHAPKANRLDLRRTADETFRVALVESGLDPLTSRSLWAAVGIERYARHGGFLGVLFIAQAALGVLAIIASLVIGIALNPAWLPVAFVPALLATWWARDANAMAAATYLSVLYSPLIVAAFAASRIEQALAFVFWLVTGAKGAMPHARPTLRWPTRDEALD